MLAAVGDSDENLSRGVRVARKNWRNDAADGANSASRQALQLEALVLAGIGNLAGRAREATDLPSCDSLAAEALAYQDNTPRRCLCCAKRARRRKRSPAFRWAHGNSRGALDDHLTL